MSKICAFVIAATGVAILTGFHSMDAHGQDAGQGKATYDKYCVSCHGPDGKGNGPDAHVLNPKPTDFTAPEVVKSLTREKILDAIINGRPGTKMGGWKDVLSADETNWLIDYIQSLRSNSPIAGNPKQP